MAPPANISFATAVTIAAFPYDFTQTDINDAGVNFTVYYRFIAPANSRVMGAWGFSGNIGAGYRPTCKPFNGPAGAPTTVLNLQGTNKPMQFPVVPGNEYFLQFLKVIDTAGPESLRVRLDIAPLTAIANGNLVVNDDTTGLPLAVLSHTIDNTLINFVKDMPASEEGANLANGIMAYEEAFENSIKIYSPSFALLFDTGLLSATIRLQACRGTSRFWVGFSKNPSEAKYLTTAGVFGPIHVLTANTSLDRLAASDDETILYFTNLLIGAPIKRWDLVNDLALSDLAAGIANYRAKDILYLSDDTIVVLYYDTGTKDVLGKRYSTAGAILNTYTLGVQTATIVPRACYANDNPNSFWVWTHELVASLGTSVFRNVKCSDGSILATRNHQEYQSGVYTGTETATPTTRFGNSNSCPLLVMLGVSVNNPSSGIYVLVPGKRNDTIYTNVDTGATEDVKIPDPKYRLAGLGE